MGTARLVKNLGGDPDKLQKIGVYELTDESGSKFVVISSIDLGSYMIKMGLHNAFCGTETFIFPSDGNEITDFGELDGSQKDTMSHKEVLNDLGYEISDALC